MVLTLALNYSARTELVDAFRSIVDAAARNGGLNHLEIDEDAVSRHLYTRHLPDPDLVVRTSGEMRLEQFPSLAVGLCRNLCNSHAVA